MAARGVVTRRTALHVELASISTRVGTMLRATALTASRVVGLARVALGVQATVSRVSQVRMRIRLATTTRQIALPVSRERAVHSSVCHEEKVASSARKGGSQLVQVLQRAFPVQLAHTSMWSVATTL